MKNRTVAPLLALTAMSCGQDRQGLAGMQSEVRDSAGIQIVANNRPADDSRLPWRIGPEPSVSIGVPEGAEPYMLYLAWDATRLRDGRIVVANVGTDELRVFDAAGVYIETWGGRGEGPGEFRSLWSVEPWPGDSIIAWYTARGGMSVFDAQGNYGRSFTLVNDEAATPFQRFSPWHATLDGSILAVHAPEVADSIVVQLRDAGGGVRSSFGAHPGREPYIQAEGTDQAMLFWKTFGRQPVWAPWGDLVVVGNTSRYELKAFGADGSLVRIVRRDHIPRLPTADDVEAHIEVEVASNSPASPAEGQRLRRRFQDVPVAETFPAFASVRSDRAGHLWVEEYEFPREDRPGVLWTVFDPEGRVLGLVETPKDLSIDEIGEDYILGSVRDDLGVEYIQLWPLERLVG
ncbi:MAG: hypothetical protein OXE96_06050 [Gemmatimonadetes bacterium]|nr:hypothetical protein [Gemmatimonadota bacterium]